MRYYVILFRGLYVCWERGELFLVPEVWSATRFDTWQKAHTSVNGLQFDLRKHGQDTDGSIEIASLYFTEERQAYVKV